MVSQNSLNVFKYNSKKYTFFANLFTGKNDDDLQISLDPKDIEEFVYESSLNSLLLTGHIIYTDSYAQLDKFLNQHVGYCEILFTENEEKFDGQITIEKMSEKMRFEHTFIISNIHIISRNQSVIKYQIDLVSNNWFNCSANIDYTNYNIGEEPIFDIFKACISKTLLQIDKESFDRVKTNINMHYITNTNDNLFSITKYLMHKLYYYHTKENAIKFFLYNETTNKYQLLSLTDKDSMTGIYSTVLSFFKTNTETIIQQEPTNIGSLEESIEKTQVYKNAFNYDMFDYSFKKNKFFKEFIEEDTTINYLNNKFDVDDSNRKYYKLFKSQLNYRQEGTYWNNTQNIYNGSIDTLELNNAMILNITGEILRKPGSFLTISLDRSTKNITNDRKSEVEKLKKKYKAFEGLWITSRVQHIISPSKQSFRQLIQIFRNYSPIIK